VLKRGVSKKEGTLPSYWGAFRRGEGMGLRKREGEKAGFKGGDLQEYSPQELGLKGQGLVSSGR